MASHEKQGNVIAAQEWLNITSAIAPRDAGVVMQVGKLAGGDTLERCLAEVRDMDSNFAPEQTAAT